MISELIIGGIIVVIIITCGFVGATRNHGNDKDDITKTTNDNISRLRELADWERLNKK